MFNNVGLDIFIGLIFIFLLYSLLASILAEMLATAISLRARNLREAVDRMLNDEENKKRDFFLRLLDSLKLTKKPTNPRIINFYNHPEIKYLGSSGIFKVPSQFQAVSFSKTLLNLLNEISYKIRIGGDTKMENPHEGDIKDIPVEEITKDRIKLALEGIVADHWKYRKELESYRSKNEPTTTKKWAIRKIDEYEKNIKTKKDEIVLDEETAKYVLSMWRDAHGDLVKFKIHLETWFDRTMEQCLEWYKRKIQIVLFMLGFLMAWIFNADTFRIIHRLSVDKDARDKLISMASAYSQSSALDLKDTTRISAAQQVEFNRVLSAMKISEDQLKVDITETNNLLGLSGWLPDTVFFEMDPIANKVKAPTYLEKAALTDAKRVQFDGVINDNKAAWIKFDCWDKWGYFLGLLCLHFWGYVLMALAISLGAPFWFDLLNKFMRLRTAVKQPLDTTKGDDRVISPLIREG
jgi:hypothetical protein